MHPQSRKITRIFVTSSEQDNISRTPQIFTRTSLLLCRRFLVRRYHRRLKACSRFVWSLFSPSQLLSPHSVTQRHTALLFTAKVRIKQHPRSELLLDTPSGTNSTYSGVSSRPETADFNAHRLPVTTHLLPSVIFRNTTIFSTKSVVATITRTTVVVDTLTKTKVYAHTTVPLPTSKSEKEYTDENSTSSFVSSNRSSQDSPNSHKLSQTKTLQPDPSVTNDSIDELLKLLSHTVC